MKICVLGAAMTDFGENWKLGLREMAVAAILEAVAVSKLELEELDAIVVSNMSGSSLAGQDHLGSLIAAELGVNIPAFRIEGACASGSLAIHTAANMLLAGNYKNILVVGAEKMTDASADNVTKALSRAADEEWESFYGVTFPSLYAMIAREYMRSFKVKRSDLALVSVKNHSNAVLNPHAHFKKEITVADVLAAAMVADPLGLLDCSPITDGAAALILSSQQKGKAELVASSVATDTIALHDRKELTTLNAAVLAARKAYQQAGITVKQINIAEVHDCFSIAELIAYEDLGFAGKGKAAAMLKSGEFNRDGRLPVNTSGGLKACGHPVGATGIKQAAEIYWQLCGRAGKRQLKSGLQYGLTHNVGGSGGTAVINIFKNV